MSSDARTSSEHAKGSGRSWARFVLIDVPLLLLASLIVQDPRRRERIPNAVPRADAKGDSKADAKGASQPPQSVRGPKPGFLRATYLSIRRALHQMDLAMILRRAAALAYYAALSLAPLIVVAVGVAGLVFEKNKLRAALVAQIEALVGTDGAALITRILESSQQKDQALLATIVGTATLLFGATAVFVELQDGLNATWNISTPKGRGLLRFIRTRFLSVAMVISTGFLLLVSLVVSTALASFTKLLHIEGLAVVGFVVHFVVSVIVTGLFFAALFKFLPDARIRWREVVIGTVITAILFNVGQIAIGQYLGRTSVGSAYGAAGSLVVILVWVYYSAAIFFIGAEITQAYATLFGAGIEARKRAPAVGTG